MNKYLTIASLVVLPFFLTACGKPVKPTEPTTGADPTQDTQATQVTQTEQQATEQQQATEKPNVFATIKDAIARQIALKCDYTDDKGNTTETYIKGSQIYMEGSTKVADKDVTFNGIMKDNKFYVWTNQSDKGLAFDLTKKVEGTTMKMGETAITSTDDVIKELEKEKNKCSPTSIADSKFDLPSGISFQEF
jgi:hypothetical protein